MRELSRQELVDVNVGILKDIHEFCSKNNIKYSLGYGTLLGAVRHHGFIPWDDDADIVMPRPDYDFFIHNYSSTKYKLLTYNTKEDNYVLPFARVSDDTTLKIEETANWKDVGIAVDIYPIDGKPTDDDKRQERRIKILKTIIRIKNTVLYKKERGLLKNICMSVLKGLCYFFNLRRTCALLDKEIQKYSFAESNLVGSYLSPYGKKDCCSKKCFNELISIDFEKELFYSITDNHQYLSNIYGNYMSPPPVSERVSVHGAKFYKR